MEKLKILIVEDELLLAEDLKQKLDQLGYDVIGIVQSGEEAIAVSSKKVPDLAILDINISGDMDGFSVGGFLKKTLNIPIIYLTQFTDLNTFEKAKAVKPSSYLTKPVNIMDLVRAIELSIDDYSVAKASEGFEAYFLQKALYLRNNEQQFERVKTEEILYLKASGAYTEVHTEQKKYIFSENLSYFEKSLVIPHLVRVHRSWIININKVDKIDDLILFIEDERIPVGKTYKKVLKQYFKMI